MRIKPRKFVAPVYLVACVVLGGSVQSAWANFALQLGGLAILVWAIARRRPIAASARLPYFIILIALVLIAVQLVPLPPELWTKLPGRGGIVEGYRLLNLPLPWLPVSESPFDSATTVFALMPPLAMFAAVQASENDRTTAAALIAATASAIVVGALQVTGGEGSSWYFYPITNSGAVGFFANSNHMATLLLVAIPFVMALLLSGKSQRKLRGRMAATWALAAIALAVILIGIALNGSLAALLLVVPVLLATAMMVPAGWRLRWAAGPLAALGLVAAVVGLSANPLSSNPAGSELKVSSRQVIWSKTAQAMHDSFPVGTGLGSFETVFPQYENPDAVDSIYIDHAHNDYLELTLELGIAGVLLIALFLGWWGVRVVQIWSSNLSSPFERAATIASAAILAHSVVDYPLRTAAIAAVLAICIAIIARFDRKEAEFPRSGARGPRHVTIG